MSFTKSSPFLSAKTTPRRLRLEKSKTQYYMRKASFCKSKLIKQENAFIPGFPHKIFYDKIAKGYTETIKNSKRSLRDKLIAFRMLISRRKITTDNKLLELFFHLCFKFSHKSIFLEFLGTILNENFELFENCEFNTFIDLICNNCIAIQDDTYRHAAYNFVIKLIELPIIVLNDKLPFTLCACYQPKKAQEAIQHLINEVNENFFLLALIKLVRKKETGKCALYILRELIFGKSKIKDPSIYHRKLLNTILDVSCSQEFHLISSEIIKCFEDLRSPHINKEIINEIKRNLDPNLTITN